MKNPNKRVIPTLCIGMGVCLLLAAAVVLVVRQYTIHTSTQTAQSCVETICALTPEPQGAVLEERRDNTMSVLSVDGTDFVGLLELPRYDSVLPVGAQWGDSSKYPCRFGGSIYDRTMQIGATSQKGQYDFYRDLSVGDTAIFTDVEGNRYTYTITDIHYAQHADQAALTRKAAALTVFIKNVYAFEYVILSCNVTA